MSANRHVYAVLLEDVPQSAPRAGGVGWSPTLLYRGLFALIVAMAMLMPVVVSTARASEVIRVGLPAEVETGLWLTTPEPGMLAMAPNVDTDVEIDVNGMIVRATVTQTYTNPGDYWAEGIYVFPLPETAAVDRLQMYIGERVVEGEIQSAEDARAAYETALAEGRNASLLEQQRPNIFTTNVANIGPGETIRIQFVYQDTVHFDAGEFRLRFPMVVGPRYIPDQGVIHMVSGGEPPLVGSTPDDWWAITPPVRNPEDGPINPISLTVNLDAGFNLAAIESPFHDVDIVESAGLVSVALGHDEDTVYADRDFELVWSPAVGEVPHAAMFRETIGGDHFVHVMVMPPDDMGADIIDLPREVIYIVDTSGSMDGASIEQARRAVALALEQLEGNDRFNVIEFNDTARALFRTAVDATDRTIGEAVGFVRGLRADGGTEMLSALQLALSDRGADGYVRQIVFITDGSVGNELEIFRYIEQNLGQSRLYTVGIGSAPNSFFMSEAAEVGRGTFTYIGSPDQVESRMGELFAKLENPVMRDLQVTYADGTPLDVEDAELWPRNIPDLYLGEPVRFTLQVDDPEAVLTVMGERAGETWSQTIHMGDAEKAEGIAAVWAYAKIDSLMDELVFGADEEDIRAQVIDIALAYEVVTQYTSLVAEDDEFVRPTGEDVLSYGLETNLPEGWVYDSVFGEEGEDDVTLGNPSRALGGAANAMPAQQAQSNAPAPAEPVMAYDAMSEAEMVDEEAVMEDPAPLVDAPTGLGDQAAFGPAILALVFGGGLLLVVVVIASRRRTR